MRLAFFISHPIQYYAPLWGRISCLPHIDCSVFYYSKQGLKNSFDAGFGTSFSWDIDLLKGYQASFLQRNWPTTDECDCGPWGLNKNIGSVLRQGWDAAYVFGYAHVNNWNVARLCRKLGIPLLMQSDSNILGEQGKPFFRKVGKQIVVRCFYKYVSVFLCMGDHNREYLLHYGAPADRIQTGMYPSDVTRFREAAKQMSQSDRLELRRKYKLAPDDFVVCAMGKLVPWKRPFDVLAAIRKLNRSNAKVLFVGTGQLQEQLAAALGTCGTITGFVNQDQVPRVLAICDVLVMASEYEPYGLAVTEAEATGLPVILSDRCGCSGPSAVFRDGESGYQYPCGDVEALSRKIAEMMDQPDVRTSMGARASELAKIHSVEAVAEQFVAAAEYAIAHPRYPRKT